MFLLLLRFVQICVWWWVGVWKLNTMYILSKNRKKWISSEIM